MSNSYLDEILPFLRRISKERREQFQTYFENVPLWLADSFVVEEIKKGTIFVREGETVNTVYLIGDGVIKATDYRVYGIPFDYMLFTRVYAFGGMEIVMDIEKYTTTLQAVTDCTVLKIPRAEFDRWMRTDVRALRHESKLIGEYLLEQARNGRAFLFLQGSERLAYLLMDRYEKYSKDGILRVNGDRQELSDFTGMCLKTITRSVKKLTEEGLISKNGKHITISQEQYLLLKEKVAKILAENG